MKRHSLRICLTALMLWGIVSSVFALGILVPSERRYPPLALVHQKVSVEVKENVARTQLQQVFYNRHNRQLEATYIFPVPKGANVTDFAMYINGKCVKGEVLERGRAREIYEDIVRRMRDPALLEYVDSQVLRVRVFPILPRAKQRIELEFTQVLPGDDGLVRYEFPLRHQPQEQPTIEDLREWSFEISLRSRTPIKTVYSPTHKIKVKHKTEKTAEVVLKPEDIVSEKDFTLYYTLSEKDYGVNLLSYRPVESEAGYFMLMVCPKREVSADETNPKDVTFVLDTSGSMARDKKLESAKEALLYCLANLRSQDRFNIIRFSTEVEALSPEFLSAGDKDSLERARHFVAKLRPRGGTNINEALLRALRSLSSEERLHTIVFITDGRPTVGVTDVSNIINSVQKENKKQVRIFNFGVGYDVNTHLLDLVAQKTSSVAEYVKPEEEIEVKVSSFFDKVANPVLTDLEIDFGRIDAAEIYPKQIPDLFAGSQLLIFGRYKNSGDAAITLTGSLKGKRQKFVYEETFPKKNDENDFVENLWAIRKVGYLLDEIGLHGENEELRDEVVALAKKYGIVTPYTSYLVTEDEERPRFAAARPHEIRAGDLRRVTASPDTYSLGIRSDSRDKGDLRKAVAQRQFFDASGGKDAVLGSIAVSKMKEETVAEGEFVGAKTVRGKTFHLVGGYWVDQEISGKESVRIPSGKDKIRIKYLSDAYFACLRVNSDLKDYFTLGEKIKVLVNGIVLEITDTGKETLTADELNKLRKS